MQKQGKGCHNYGSVDTIYENAMNLVTVFCKGRGATSGLPCPILLRSSSFAILPPTLTIVNPTDNTQSSVSYKTRHTGSNNKIQFWPNLSGHTQSFPHSFHWYSHSLAGAPCSVPACRSSLPRLLQQPTNQKLRRENS